MRVLIDTNVYISYLLTLEQQEPAVHRALALAFSEEVTLLVPIEQLEELRRVLASKPYLVRRITPAEARAFIDALSEVAQILSRVAIELPRMVRDPKDD